MAKKTDDRRGEILTVAAKLFAERPFHEVKIDDVAARAHISKGTVYLYFDSKEDLYVSIVQAGADLLVRRLESRAEAHTGTAIELLREMLRDFAAFAVGHPAVFRLVCNGRLPEDDPESRVLDERVQKLIEGTLRRGQKAGEFTDKRPKLTARFLSGVIIETMKHATGPVDPIELADHAAHIFLDGLRPR